MQAAEPGDLDALTVPDETGLGRGAQAVPALLTLPAQLPHRLVEAVEGQRIHSLVHQPLEDRGRRASGPNRPPASG